MRDQLLELVRSFRIGNLVLMVQHGSMPRALVEKNITLLAEHVLPALREVWKDEAWVHHWWPKGRGN